MTAAPGQGGAGSVGRVDLHCHSTASDGTLSPTELAQAAALAGLVGAALTDHDTVEGVTEFLEAGRAAGLTAVGGVEISLEHTGTMHLLGYNVAGRPGIPSALERLKTFRVERNLKMLDLLGRQGYYLSWDRLLEKSGGGQMGRPHFAALLLEKGYFKTREEVFDKLLAKGRPGYVDKVRLNPDEGLAMIRAAGWAPVLAHPVSLGLTPGDWPDFLKTLTDDGLLGLEVLHPSHTREQHEFFLGLARRFGLVPTAGSDFHGANKPAVTLSWGLTASPYGLEMVDRLRDKLNSHPVPAADPAAA